MTVQSGSSSLLDRKRPRDNHRGLEVLLANRKLWHINNAALAALDELQLDLRLP